MFSKYNVIVIIIKSKHLWNNSTDWVSLAGHYFDFFDKIRDAVFYLAVQNKGIVLV